MQNTRACRAAAIDPNALQSTIITSRDNNAAIISAAQHQIICRVGIGDRIGKCPGSIIGRYLGIAIQGNRASISSIVSAKRTEAAINRNIASVCASWNFNGRAISTSDINQRMN